MKQIGKLGAGTVPPDTNISISIQPDVNNSCLVLSLVTSNDTVIKVCIKWETQKTHDNASKNNINKQTNKQASKQTSKQTNKQNKN